MMRKFRIDSETKRILKKFGIFFGMIFGMCLILVVFSLLARNSWKNGLALEVQKVLDSYPDAHYTVANFMELDSGLSTSCAVYSLLKKDDNKKRAYYGVIVRIPSILGPLPAVFIYSKEEGVVFAGYAVDNGKASDTVSKDISNNIMKYWEKTIPEIISKVHED